MVAGLRWFLAPLLPKPLVLLVALVALIQLGGDRLARGLNKR